MRTRRSCKKFASQARLARLAHVSRAAALGVLAGLLGFASLAPMRAQAASDAPVRIGIIGSGHIGGTLARLWVQAGDEVMLSSRHPEELKDLAQSLGPRAHTGTPAEAAKFGQAVLLAVPYPALTSVAQEVGPALKGKVVLDATNPFPPGSPVAAKVAQDGGTGITNPRLFPGASFVRAFSTLPYATLEQNAHRAGEPLALPIAGDDRRALSLTRRLVHDAGFEAVVVGNLASAKRFDVGSSLNKPGTAADLRAAFGVPAK